MENPFSPEQIQKLNAISQLPAEEQRTALQAFLQTLTPEQIDYLKQQQTGGECPFCLIAQGKITASIVYEDAHFFAALDIRPATKGHVVLFPKQHYPIVAAMPDGEIASLFLLANQVSKQLYEQLQCLGTNILVANGEAAGQMVGHVLVHVIPRYKDDKVILHWEGKPAEEKELKDIQQTLQGKIMLPPRQALASEPKAVQKEVQKEVKEDEWYYAFEERVP
ncbi:MAG: HIT family protein [Nanoarchaeota archaeon]